MAMPYIGFSTATVTKDDASDIECAPDGQAGVRYETPYTPLVRSEHRGNNFRLPLTRSLQNCETFA
jgi:hypothetical protein